MLSSDRAVDGDALLTIVMPIKDDGRHIEALLQHWRPILASRELTNDVAFVLVDESTSAGPVQTLEGALIEAGFSSRICRQAVARGPGHARSQGFDLVASAYVCFLDVDDRPDPVEFVTAARAACRSNLDVVALDYLVEVRGNVIERGGRPRQDRFWEDLLCRRVGVWRFVFRVDFLRSAGIYFPDWDYAEDLAFLLQCVEKDARADFLPKVGYTYVMHGQGLSGGRPSRSQTERVFAWLLRRDVRDASPAGRYLRALWLARIGLLGGWSTAPRVLTTLPDLARNPVRTYQLASQAVRSRWTRRRTSSRGDE